MRASHRKRHFSFSMHFVKTSSKSMVDWSVKDIWSMGSIKHWKPSWFEKWPGITRLKQNCVSWQVLSNQFPISTLPVYLPEKKCVTNWSRTMLPKSQKLENDDCLHIPNCSSNCALNFCLLTSQPNFNLDAFIFKPGRKRSQ